MNCIYCNGKCIKKGKRNRTQNYQCNECKKYQQSSYKNRIYTTKDEENIKALNNEGVGIRSISRILRIPKSTVQGKIESIAKKITHPEIKETEQMYEIDELRTFVGNKKNESWVIYGINKIKGHVIDFCVGRRTKENLKKVVESILKLNPKKIFTDGLNIYPSLIPKAIHKVFVYNTNKIERHNLTLRTHIKRLTRKTICFSRSKDMLYNCVKLYLS